VIIELDESDILFAWSNAGHRRASAIGAKRTHAHRYDGGPYGSLMINYIGSLGEIAVAKAYNRFWSGTVGSISDKDVGPWQVRTTQLPGGRLPLHEGDADADRFFLVTVTLEGVATIRGWCWGHEGKLREYWDDKIREACYMVPQSALHAPPPSFRARLSAVAAD
jgi:hypothetical protein